jgi:hypothetical protein
MDMAITRNIKRLRTWPWIKSNRGVSDILPGFANEIPGVENSFMAGGSCVHPAEYPLSWRESDAARDRAPRDST